jgi:hypothetical protein
MAALEGRTKSVKAPFGLALENDGEMVLRHCFHPLGLGLWFSAFESTVDQSIRGGRRNSHAKQCRSQDSLEQFDARHVQHRADGEAIFLGIRHIDPRLADREAFGVPDLVRLAARATG